MARLVPCALKDPHHDADDRSVKTVLAHEWLITPAGSDKVAARIADAFDVDEVVTAIENPLVSRELMGNRPIRPLWTNRLPNAGDWRMRYAPALLGAWASTKIEADVLISSSHFGAMGAGRRFDGPHVAYCHSPMRFVWRPDLESDRVTGSAGRLARNLVPTLRRIDRSAAESVTLFVANSTSIATRIHHAYGRPAVVVHPCVDTDRFESIATTRAETSENYLLCFGRLVAYKRIDLAVRVCTERSLPLIVAGDGPELARLRALAGPTVTFEQNVSDTRYLQLLAGSRALLFPGEEDFGIVPVEAMAAGVPVVAYGVGGALDTVVDGVTGVLFHQQTVAALSGALDLFAAARFDLAKLSAHVEQFRPERFDARLRDVVEGHLRVGQRDRWQGTQV
jgi:glycosyltransferase involved in cell wall biosynthesis